MKIANFNQTPLDRIKKMNDYLKENHGVKVTGFHTKNKLETVREKAEMHVVRLRNTNKKFNIDPEYAKYLGVRDVIDTMLEEGVYADSPALEGMRQELNAEVQNLMDGGYTVDEACAETMNRYRQDPRYAYDDEFVLPIVIKAAKAYESSCNRESIESDINEPVLRELAKEVGIDLETVDNYDAIEEKLGTFANVSGKSRDAVVGFLNGLELDSITPGIQMFGAKIGEQNKFTGARQDAIEKGEKEFEVDGKTYKVSGDTKDEEKQAKKESKMFDDIVDEMIAEEVEVEQAEVVMAIRALADDVQNHIERIGRMVNEDIPAIADQMVAEFGVDQAGQIKDQMEQALQALLDANKVGKDGVDAVVGQLTGMGSLADAGAPMDAPVDAPVDAEAPVDAPVDNVPAAAGPEAEPLGRAEVEPAGEVPADPVVDAGV
jgi:hypothetical protein|tara:strand:- start:379 stop:1677 length:1299 start_codon:yes stop_codon:yes gene_type:complete